MGPPSTYTDAELATAIGESRSWRDVMRRLGLKATSGGSSRSVRRHADRIGVSYAHFTGQRRWSDAQLRVAVAESSTWLEVLTRLGLADGGGSLVGVRGNALRMSLDTEHLNRHVAPPRPPQLAAAGPRLELLRTAAASVAAAWFQLRGFAVHWPLEPCRYDLVVEACGEFQRIQVKTTTRRTGDACVATISSTRQATSSAYDVDDIDHFFIVDDRLDAYLIPIAAVAGRQTISLRGYSGYLVARRGNLLTPPDASADDGEGVDLDPGAGQHQPGDLHE